jgi:transcriptional antiterminator Rof (Rho-off)
MNEQEMIALHNKIDAGVKAAVAAAIERHRKLGESIAVWQDGKVVILTADRIPPMTQK